MDLEDIQKAWDSQEEHPVLEVDETSLRSHIRTRVKTFGRLVGWTEIFTAGMLLFIAAMFLRDPLVEGHDLVLIVPAIASLVAAGFVITGRVLRKKREVAYDDTIKGIVEKSISQIDYHTKRLNSFLWWFAAPMTLGLLIGIVIVDASKRYLFFTVFIPLFVLSIGLCYWQIKKEIKNKLVPEKDSLASLLKTLGETKTDD